MKVLITLAQALRTGITSYRFNDDHRAELHTIEAVHDVYRARLDAAGPSRYLWRSVCQYRCQAYARSCRAAVLANVVSLACLPLLMILLRPASERSVQKRRCQYLKLDFHPAYQVPAQIRIDTLEVRPQRRYLTWADLARIAKIFVRGRAFYPELMFKFALWVAAVRPILDQYSPAYLLQYCEYSAHSSLRKLYLNSQGILLANVTHGEELVSCRSAFASFDQYFAWELTPRSIHEAMRIEYSERFTFNPCAGLPAAAPVPSSPVIGILWPAIDDSHLDALAEAINALGARYTVLVRRHPNPKYANRFNAYRCRLAAQESDAQRENVHDYIDRCSVVVGYLSAVLLQGVLRGRDVIYLQDEQLASLMSYHDYYRAVTAVDLPDLVQYLCRKFGGGAAP